MYDIAIIGRVRRDYTAAVTGAAYRVLLVERDSWTGAQPCAGKCCGGLLAPDAQGMLSRLGWVAKSVLQEPQLFVVRAIDVPHRLERYYQRHYINMDREQFDRGCCRWCPVGLM